MIIPTIFVEKGGNFKERFDLITSLSKNVQIDFMDGKFVKSTSVSLNEIPDLKSMKGYVFEAHLMMEFPQNYIERLADKGFKKVIFHYETVPSDLDVKYVGAMIKRHGMTPVVALNPETPAEKIFYLDTIKNVLLLGVNPGKEKQTFIDEVYEKVTKLKEKGFFVQVDGGVNLKVAEKLFKLGCDAVNTGSFVSNSKNPKKALNDLNSKWK